MIDQGCWHVTEDELDALAAKARYAYAIHRMATLSPGSKIDAWGTLSYGEKHAWMDAVTAVLFSMDKMGHTSESVVVDYD